MILMHLVKFDLEVDFQVKFIVQYDICVGTLLCDDNLTNMVMVCVIAFS